MTITGLITARGGSKGLPGKNTRPLRGKPLLTYTVEAALKADLDDVVLSTDDPAIAAAGRAAGARVPFMRPNALATDEATTLDVILHAAGALDLTDDDIICLLQPTSPLRTAQDLRDALKLYQTHRAPVIGVVRATKPLSWLHALSPEGRLTPRFEQPTASRRQLAEELFWPNGAIYVASLEQWRAGDLMRGAIPHEMPPERSVDIDTLTDFLLAELLLSSGDI